MLEYVIYSFVFIFIFVVYYTVALITLKNDDFITMIELNNHIPHPSSLIPESSQKFQLAQHYFTIHNTSAECISFTFNNMLQLHKICHTLQLYRVHKLGLMNCIGITLNKHIHFKCAISKDYMT